MRELRTLLGTCTDMCLPMEAPAHSVSALAHVYYRPKAPPGRPPGREPTDSTGLTTFGCPAPPGREVVKTLHGSRRWRACGGTYSRRRSPAILDHDARRIPTGATTALIRTHREPKDYRFRPPVLAVSVSLDHERPERSSNRFCGTLRAGSAKCVGRQFFWVRTLS